MEIQMRGDFIENQQMGRVPDYFGNCETDLKVCQQPEVATQT
jgi:hypothetical protein